MNHIAKFLSWFEGFAENIKAKPDAEQWQRVKDKVAELAQLATQPEAVHAGYPFPPPPEPPKPVKPSTPTQWKAMYQGRLIELGVDMDSAKEFTHDVAVNMDVMPDIQAEADVATLLN